MFVRYTMGLIGLGLLLALGCAQRPESPTGTLTTRPGESSRPDRTSNDPYFQAPRVTTGSRSPQVLTRNVLQSRSGDLWLATWEGIVRSDGTSFTNINEAEGLPPFRVFSVFEDRDGVLWFGTLGAGAYRYDGKTYSCLTMEDGLRSDTVLSIHQDASGHLWFGGSGATRYDGSNFTSYGEAEGFTDADVHSIAEAPDGSLWFGTRGALFRYHAGFENFTAKHGVSIEPSSYTPAVVDLKGHVWFGGSVGLHHFDGETVRRLSESDCFSLIADSRGNLWFSEASDSQPVEESSTILYRLPATASRGDIVAASERYDILPRAVFGMMEDRDGNIWFGSERGIWRITGSGAVAH